MGRTGFIVVFAAGLLWLAIPRAAHAEPAGGGSGSGALDAATWYERAAVRLAQVPLSELERETLNQYRADFSRGPSDAVRRIVARFRPAINLTRRGAGLDEASFAEARAGAVGFAGSDDFRAVPAAPINAAAPGPAPSARFVSAPPLPAFAAPQQLRELRALADVVRDDFLIRLHDGDAESAADRIATLYRMSIQAGNSATLPGLLAAYDIFDLAELQTAAALDHAALGPVTAARLLAALKPLEESDPFSAARAIRRERERYTLPMFERYAGDDGALRLSEDAAAGRIDLATAQLSDRTPAEIDAALRGQDTAMAHLILAFSEPERDKSKAQIERLAAKIERGEYGPLAAAHLTGFDALYRAQAALPTRVRQARELLSGLADGSTEPMSLANAAVWYLRAIIAIEGMKTDERAAVRNYALTYDRKPPHVTALALHEAKPIIDTLLTAGSIDRCDFWFAHSDWPRTFRHYHAGMREAAALLRADAARYFHEAVYAGAADRLEAGYQLSAHLAGDSFIASALVAADAFAQNDALAAGAMDAGAFTDEQVRAFADAVQSFERFGGLGFEGALSAQRAEAHAWFMNVLAAAPAQDMRAERAAIEARAEEIMKAAPGETILFILAVRDATDQTLSAGFQAKSGARDKPERALMIEADEMEGVFDVDQLHAAAAAAEVYLDMLQQGHLDVLIGADAPQIAPVEDRHADARRDLRRCQQRLSSESAPGVNPSRRRGLEHSDLRMP